ncbi:Fructosamine kinase-domain-containing protein [Nemania sp. FL0031]|nr:Fructosamine kinase-domain-containing protein [Nemania sp. FL0031]
MASISGPSKHEMPRDDTIVTDYIHPHSLNTGVPTEEIKPPRTGQEVLVDKAVLEALNIPGAKLQEARQYGSSLWGRTAKLTVQLPDGTIKPYFLKVVPNEDPGKHMCEGEYESLKAMNEVVPSFIPKVYAWGPLEKGPGYFLLAEFRDVGKQPPDPPILCKRLAELHMNSKSPEGKFGFHVTTCHGNLPQDVGWEASWTEMFTKILSRAMSLDLERHGPSREFSAYKPLLFDIIIPRLLRPLETEGRSIKPCLIHGDIWDENCADDANTGEPFAFDAGSLYAHNEYEIGYWRPPRHRLSNRTYIEEYKRHFPVSEPKEDWDDRHILYSMRFNISCSVLVPNSGQRQVIAGCTNVLEDMKFLCRKYCPEEVERVEAELGVKDESGV